MMNQNSIYDIFLQQVRLHPDNEAVCDILRTLSYSQFDGLVDAIRLRMPVVRPGKVGIIMDHGAEQIASMFAVIKSGGAYVAAEPSFPQGRIEDMMSQANVDFVIVSPDYEHRFRRIPTLVIEPGLELSEIHTDPEKVTAETPAYVLFTSGTTGRPKGIVVTNGNVCHYVRAFAREFHPEPDFRMLQHSVCTFDIFVEEVFATVLNGGTLVIPHENVKESFDSLLDFMERRNVTAVSGFPYLMIDFNKALRLPSSLRLLISGGDVLRASYVDNLLDKVTVYNTYGPSETTVCASYYKCNGHRPLPDGTYPIGRPVKGVDIRIVSAIGEDVPAGTVGEICISGSGVSSGYLHDCPESDNFRIGPDGHRCYMSGDLGYMNHDGQIAFLRRKDRQVMILGKRVECDEVENVICSCPEIESAVVEPRFDSRGLAYLTAYVVPRMGRAFSVGSLKKKISRYLTSFMIPERFVMMNRMPLTPNGKPDRKALRDKGEN